MRRLFSMILVAASWTSLRALAADVPATIPRCSLTTSPMRTLPSSNPTAGRCGQRQAGRASRMPLGGRKMFLPGRSRQAGQPSPADDVINGRDAAPYGSDADLPAAQVQGGHLRGARAFLLRARNRAGWRRGGRKLLHVLTVDIPKNPNYSECDFEYLPGGGWGQREPALLFTTWRTADPLPDGTQDNVHTVIPGRLAAGMSSCSRSPGVTCTTFLTDT